MVGLWFLGSFISQTVGFLVPFDTSVAFDPFEVGGGCAAPEVVGGCTEPFFIRCVEPGLVFPGRQVYIKAIDDITGVSNTCYGYERVDGL